MNKLKGYVIYSKDQQNDLADFLAKSDGCEYTQIPAIESELVSLIGADNLFDLPKAQDILRRQIKEAEIAQTLSHIQCWKEILDNSEIEENELVIIAEPTISLLPHYYEVLSQHVESFHQHSKYEVVLLQRSDNDPTWNERCYTGEGEISSIVFNLANSYNKAKCAMYLIRKRFIREKLKQLEMTKPYWLAYYFAEYCPIELAAQVNKLLATPNNATLLKYKKPVSPKFSIIIPVYNVEKYLSEAIESVLAQDFYDYEIILVNDGSIDESAKLCLAYSEKYPHITFVSKSNRGLSATRNLGIHVARGEYLMFLDSDDFWRHNHVLSDLENIIQEKPVDFVITYISSLIDNTEIIEHVMSSDKLTGDYTKDFYELVDNKTFQGYAVIKVVKRELVITNNIYFPEGRSYEDVQWSYFLGKYIKSYALYNSPYYMYRRERIGSISEFLSPEKVADMLSIFEKCYTDLRNTIKRDNIYNALKLFIMNFGDYIKLCHSKLFPDQQESIKVAYNAFIKDLEQLKAH